MEEDYKRDGYVVARGAVDPELLGEMQDHVEWLGSRDFLQGLPPEHWHHPIMRNDPFWVRLVSDARLLDLAQRFVGPDIALFSSHYFCKMPGTGRPGVPWHQDGSYWPLWPMDAVTLWLAVDRSDVENGCLKVVRGSHRMSLTRPGGREQHAGFGTHSDEEARELGELVNVELNPGDASVHHPNLVHSSGPNCSEPPRRRCGLSIRYMRSAVHCVEEEQPVLLLRGAPTPGVPNWYRSWPKYRPGHDMPFAGCGTWNTRRFKDLKDEAGHLSRTDYRQMEKEVRASLDGFVRELQD